MSDALREQDMLLQARCRWRLRCTKVPAWFVQEPRLVTCLCTCPEMVPSRREGRKISFCLSNYSRLSSDVACCAQVCPHHRESCYLCRYTVNEDSRMPSRKARQIKQPLRFSHTYASGHSGHYGVHEALFVGVVEQFLIRSLDRRLAD